MQPSDQQYNKRRSIGAFVGGLFGLCLPFIYHAYDVHNGADPTGAGACGILAIFLIPLGVIFGRNLAVLRLRKK